MKNINNSSISALEGWNWKGEIPDKNNESFVVFNFYRLHNKPIGDYRPEDIRFMIEQNTGLEYLVPIAIELLKENIFTETEFYPGDMLYTLLTIHNESNYWTTHQKQQQQLAALYNKQKKLLGNADITEDIRKKIKEAYHTFVNTLPSTENNEQ